MTADSRIDWRLVLAGVLLLGLGVALTVGTGAVSVPDQFSPLAEEGDEIEGAETGREVFLAPADTPEGDQYADLNDEGELELDVSELPPEATTTLDDVFVVGFEPENDTTTDGDVRTARIGVSMLEDELADEFGLDPGAVTFVDATGAEIASDRADLSGDTAITLNDGDQEPISVQIDTRGAEGQTDGELGANTAAASTLTLQVLADVRVGVADLRILEQPTAEQRLIGTAANPDEEVFVEVGLTDRNGNLIEGIERDAAVTVRLDPVASNAATSDEPVTIAEDVDVDEGTARVDLRELDHLMDGTELGPAGPLGAYEIEIEIDADATTSNEPVTIRGETVELVHRAIDVNGDGVSTFATPIDLATDVRTTFTATPEAGFGATAFAAGSGGVADNQVASATISRFDGPGLGPSGLDGEYEVGFADDQAQQVHQGYFLQVEGGAEPRETERIGLNYRQGGLDQPAEFELAPGAHLLGTVPNTADPREYEATIAEDAGVEFTDVFEPTVGGPSAPNDEVGPADTYWVIIEEDGQERFVFVPGFDPEE